LSRIWGTYHVRGIALFIAILNPVITIPFLLSGYNVVSVSLVKFFVDIAALMVYFIFSFFSQRLQFKNFIEKREKYRLIKEIVYFCAFIMLYVTVDTINKSFDKIILGFMGLPELVSIYALGRAFLEYTYLASVYISANYIQIINHRIVSKQYREVNAFFIKLSKTGLIMMFFIFGGFLVSGNTFVHSWLSNSTYTENELHQIYWIALSLIFVHIVPFSQVSAIEIQRGYNKHYRPTIILIISALINIGLTIGLINLFPRENAVWACLISTIITTFISQWIVLNIFYKKELYLDVKAYYLLFLKNMFIALIPSVICIIAYTQLINLSLYMSGWLVFLVQGSSYVMLYSLFLFLFEKHLVIGSIKRIWYKIAKIFNH